MIQQPLQDFITTGDRRIVALVLGGLLALVAVTVGLALAVVGPVYTAVGLAALAAGVWVIAGLENALWGVLAVITLLPFAPLPVDIGITPTFLDMALGVAVGLYLLQWMTGERRRLTMTPVHGFIILFMLLCLFSFVAGMRHAGMSFTVARRLLELLLAMAFALILVDVLDTAEKIKRFVLVLLAGGTLAALIAIGLWILPDGTAASILGRLAIIGYPNAGIIQYIEQNPALSERAIGTAVNPNSLGGTLVLIAALAVPQLAAEQPLTGKRWHAVPVLGALGLALVLTFSRGSMLAFAAAVGFIAVLRYRKLLIVFAVLGVIFLLLPWTQGYIERFIAGFQGADLATQMRFG
ncbi:MAG: hypothetical protein ACFB51_09360 [Anaerolineae bacterium]